MSNANIVRSMAPSFSTFVLALVTYEFYYLWLKMIYDRT